MFAESGAAIYTLGVGALFVENIARTIEAREVEYLIDVRSAPHAIDRPELEPDALEEYLLARGTRYLNLSEKLGDRPRDISLIADGRVDYRRYRERPFALEGLARIEQAWKIGCRVCILGRETDPVRSHRARLVGHALHQRGVAIRHLHPYGSRIMTHPEVLRHIWTLQNTIDLSHQDPYHVRARR